MNAVEQDSDSDVTWADDTTQDRLEADAQQHGWIVAHSTFQKTVLVRADKMLTITFSTRVRDGKIYTAIETVTLKLDHWSPSKGYQAHNLIARYGRKAQP